MFDTDVWVVLAVRNQYIVYRFCTENVNKMRKVCTWAMFVCLAVFGITYIRGVGYLGGLPEVK